MHIGFLTCEYPPLPGGGIGTGTQNLARALVRAGHRVTVIGWGTARGWEDEGVRVRFLDGDHPPKTGWLLNRVRAQQALRRLVREESLAIVEAHDWCGPSAGIDPGCPVVVRLNGTATYFADMLGESVRPSVRWAEWLALRSAAGLAGVSRFTADRTREVFALRKPIRTVFNGIDVARFSPAECGEAEPNSILYFGTVVRKKGVLDLCAAFSRVIERLPRARLRVIGRDAPDRRSGSSSTWALCRDVLSPAAARNVEYLGEAPYSGIAAYIRRAAVCVFPSYAEGLPLSWLEAMACGKPVIAYSIGWAPEVVVNEATGLLSPAGDIAALAGAVVSLLKDEALARSMGRNARRRVEERFSAGRAADETLEWYRSVLER